MKIGIVCPYNMFKGGGVQECVLATQAELIKRGHDVKVITPKPRGKLINVPENMIFVGSGADIKTVFHTTAQVSVALNNDVVDEILEREAFDVLHFHEPWISMVSRQILSRSKAKNIATFHAKLPENMMARTLEKVAAPYMKAVLKYIDELTAVSDAAAEYLRSITQRSVTIIPNGIDLAKYQTKHSAQEKDSDTVLYVGRLERRKGIKYLLRSMQVVQENHPKARLLLAGDGPDKNWLSNYARELGVEAEFLGFVDDKTKLELLNSARIFCSPAPYGESFGIVLLEAMAVGLPVVAGDNSGYASVMVGSGRLSLVDPHATTEMARRIELFLYDEGVRKLWQNWSKTAVKQYDYKKVVDEYEKLYGKA